MSDLNDDLLNYELGDDILDQVFYGADEDELLLSDDDLEKDVSKEEKKQLKAEAEEWVKSKIQKDMQQKNAVQGNEQMSSGNKSSEFRPKKVQGSPNGANSPKNKELIEVTSTASVTSAEVTTACITKESAAADENLNEMAVVSVDNSQLHVEHLSTISDEVSSSNYKDAASSSSNSAVTVLKSSQEDFTKDVTCGLEFSDPREDFEEDREEARTNIKTKNERDLEPVIDIPPEKLQGVRYPHSKRMPRLHPNMRNFNNYNNQRPLLRFPPAHGQFQINNQVYVQQPQNKSIANTQNANTHLQISTTTTQPHQIEGMRPVRHPYPGPGFRPPVPLVPGPYRQMNPNGTIFPHGPHPHEFVSGPYGTNNFLPNSMGLHASRGMFRAEMPQIIGGAPGMRPVMRLQRPPVQGLPTHNYGLPPPALRHALPPQSQPLTGVQVQQPTAAHALNMPNNIVTNPQTMRPSKVLINPNFKGGVEAATSKFIKETQYMANMGGGGGAAVSSPTKSDAELLRQQEEFINKNRQYIEKKRQERYSPLSGPRRSTSHSRSRSHSRERVRERSYSPTNKRGTGSGYFERDRERDRERERDRDRERFVRANSRERERLGTNAGNNNANRPVNRFRRAGSRERDYYEHRANNYNKRRRSLSPNRGSGRRGNDRDRNEMEEDEETRAYRQEIEKQKALREKILRDKELKRRRAAEEKLQEDKREDPQQQTHAQANQSQPQPQQKLKPLIVTERKIITLKKRASDEQQQQVPQRQQSEKKQITTATILPEGKRTLTGHLSAAGKSNNKNEKLDVQQAKSSQKNMLEVRKLSAPSDDEVELDYDEDDLILDEEEDRLLASPLPSPTAVKRSSSRSPPPQQNRSVTLKKNNKIHNTINNSNHKGRLAANKNIFNASNRRVVLKSSSSSSTTTSSTMGGNAVGVSSNSKSQRDYETSSGSHGRNRSGNNSSNHREHIFDRLDAGNKHSKQQQQPQQQQQHQRVVIKHS